MIGSSPTCRLVFPLLLTVLLNTIVPLNAAPVNGDERPATNEGILHQWQLTADRLVEQAFVPQVGGLTAVPTDGVQFSDEAPQAVMLQSDGKNHPHLVVSSSIRQLKLPASAITLSTWVRIEKPLEWGGIVGAMQDNGSYEKGWLLGYRNHQFCFALNSQGSSSLTYLTAPAQFEPGYWYHVVGTYDGRIQKLYVDGILTAQSTEQSGDIVMPADAMFVIGAYRDLDELYGMTGQIEQIQILDRALSDQQVRASFDARRQRFPEIDAVRPEVTDWPTWQRDSQRTGITAEPLSFPLQRKWTWISRHAPAPAWPAPARQDFWHRKFNLSPRVIYDRAFHVVTVGSAVLFASSADDRVTCLDADSGALRWTFFAEAPVRLAPTIDQDRVLFGADDGRVYCLNIHDGQLLWRVDAYTQDLRMPGNGRMINARPVRTGVIVDEGVAWFCSGLFPNQGVEQFAVSVQDGRLLDRGPLNISPQGYLERRGGRLFVPTGRDPAGAFAAQLKRRGKGVGREVNQIGDDFRFAFIGAGDVRLGGGAGQVAAFSASDGSRLWSAEVDGTAWSLAAAGGCLYVATDTGRIECFASAEPPPSAPLSTADGASEQVTESDRKPAPIVIDECQLILADSPMTEVPDEITERAAEIVRIAAVRRGWCLALTADPQLLAEIARQSEWQIIGVTADPGAADQARRQLADLGLYGRRISLHCLEPDKPLPYSNYLFNVIVGPAFAETESLQQADTWPSIAFAQSSELQRVLRPSGGVALLSRDPEGVLRRGPLEGIGEWTHLYANPGNTICSEDTHDYSRLQLQWFGEPGPREMIDRHHRTSAPLFTNGRLLIPGDNRVYAVDAYNGTVLWEREIPDSRRVAVFRDCSQMAAMGDRVFVVSGDHCLVLDAETGAVMRTLNIPDNHEHQLEWGYLACLSESGLIIGSGVSPGASRRQTSREVAATETFWDHVPLVGSRRLFAIDPNDGRVVWSFAASTGLIINPAVAVAEGNVLLVESNNAQTLAADNGRATAQQMLSDGAWLTAIDVSSGSMNWRKPLDMQKVEHNIYLSASQGKVVAVGSRNSGKSRDESEVLYDISVFDADGGRPVWSTTQRQGTKIGGDHGEQDHRPVIVKDRLYCEPFGYQLHTGRPLIDFQWNAKHRRGCGNLAASASTFFFRENVASMFDLRTNTYAQVTQVTRPGCWINILPAGGLLLIPEASSGCTCNFPIQTSLAFLPAPPLTAPGPE